jgi:hypothetical protein
MSAALGQSAARSFAGSSSASARGLANNGCIVQRRRRPASPPAAAAAAADCPRRRLLRARHSRRQVAAASTSNDQQQQPDALYELVARNQQAVRTAPIWAGALGFASLLANRALSGVAPVVDAGSGQSRADVLGILMSAALLLSGLQWLALRGREPEAVDLGSGTPRVEWVDRGARLPLAAEREMRWAWRALSSTARCSSLVVFLRGRCVAHFGAAAPEEGGSRGAGGSAAAEGGGGTVAAAPCAPGAAPARPGAVVQECVSKGQGQYLANLVLYPGRGEFVAYLPEATQGVAVQPFGGGGVAAAARGGKAAGAAGSAAAGAAAAPPLAGCLVVGSDTVRGLSRLDQAWLATLADKLEVSLEGWRPGGDGFGGGKA